MKRTINISPSVEELAEEFSKLDSDDMALFMNIVGKTMSNWGPMRLESQVYDLIKSDVINSFGSRLLSTMVGLSVEIQKIEP